MVSDFRVHHGTLAAALFGITAKGVTRLLDAEMRGEQIAADVAR